MSRREDSSKPPAFDAPLNPTGSSRGMCYPAAEALYHALGGKDAGLTPMQVTHEGVSHWYLRWETTAGTFYIDPTADQFETLPSWAEGTGRGFLTKEPSRRASRIVPVT